MTEYALVDRWDHASRGAPQKRLEEIRGEFDEYFEECARYGITRDNYLLAVRDALEDSRDLIAGSVRSRAATHRAGPGAALWSTIVATVKTLLNTFGRVGWTVFWAGNRKLRKIFGLRERAVWERLRMLRDIEWLKVWNRSDEDHHDYELDEPISNVYFLRVPLAIWQFWTATPEGRRFVAKHNKGASIPEAPTEPAPAGGPESAAPRSSAPQAVPPRSARPRSSAPASSESAPHWFPELFHRLRAQRYTTDGGTITDPLLIPIENMFEGAAASLHGNVLKRGQTPPELTVLRDELATAAILEWFKDPGGNDYLLKNEHPIGPIWRNAPALSKAAAAHWWEAWKQTHPLKPLSLREPSVPRAPTAASHAIAKQVAEQAAEPPQLNPVLRQSPFSDRRWAEWQACQLDEATGAEACEDTSAEVAAPVAELANLDVSGVPELTDDEPSHLDLDGELETMESAVDQRPDPAPD